MDTEYTEKEIAALDKKFEEPEKEVICPRCGKVLIYTQRGNSCEVKCESAGCLQDAMRGL